MDLVIVESPAKAKSIHKYLGSGFKVLASYGHVRDLLSKTGSVRPEDGFTMAWQVDDKAKKHLSEIEKALKTCERLILATDPDREGEAISWHVLEILTEKGVTKGKSVERVVFNAITRHAVLEAMKKPRALDQSLVSAYLARRALDYLVGFTLSPVLWRKLPGARSAGRVQSVALRLVCEREKEIETFQTQEYWTLEAQCATEKQEIFSARLVQKDHKKLDKFAITEEAAAREMVSALKDAPLRVASVETKPVKRFPQPPFITSTLQQEASRKLGFSSKKTMQIAQKLYEGFEINGELTGLITYMRTDGVQIAPEALSAARDLIEKRYGRSYLPPSPRHYKTKAKNAQEAHEAIRPTDLFRTPEDIRSLLEKDHWALYDLIWKRAVASQMEVAQFQRVTADLHAKGRDGVEYGLRAVGTTLTFDGFLKLYQEGVDDEGEEEDKRLPSLKEGEEVSLRDLKALQHFTEPPPRYSEASLIKKMEEIGIGRPSTYTSILSVLHDRGYVRQEQKKLIPEDKGRLVTVFLESFFAKYVGYDFTADLEEQLDGISSGEGDWKKVLERFWEDFSQAIKNVQDLRVTHVIDTLNEELASRVFLSDDEGRPIKECPLCKEGVLSLRLGKFGAFVGCSGYPTCSYTRHMGENTQELSAEPIKEIPSSGKVLGQDSETQEDILLFEGRFGPYVQKGRAKKGKKPSRCGVPLKFFSLEEVHLDLALKLLSLPREVGRHPETKEPIEAGLGRFGPYVRHQKHYARITEIQDLFTIGVNHAVALLADHPEKKGSPARSSRKKTPAPLKELGVDPESQEPIVVLTGRFGPYLKCGKDNIKIPKGIDWEHLTPEDAQRLVAQKREG